MRKNLYSYESKKEIGSHHSEVVVDKDWNEVAKEKKMVQPKFLLVIPLFFVQFIVLFMIASKNPNDSVGTLIGCSCISFWFTTMVSYYIENRKAHKKHFSTLASYVFGFGLGYFIFILGLIGIIPSTLVTGVISIFAIVFGVFGYIILSAIIKTKSDTK